MGNHFYKQQTKWSWIPASIHCESHLPRGTTITICIRGQQATDPDACDDCRDPGISEIDLTPHEALALAAWLQAEADKMIQRKVKAEKKRVDRLIAKSIKKHGGPA